MKVVIGADHGGFELKQEIGKLLASDGHEISDLGAHRYDALDDYPDFALAVARAVAAGEAERGIVVCGSGVGACVAANKIRGARAGLCHDTYSAHQGVEHDDMNVLCLGARIIGIEIAREIVRSYVGAAFSGEQRHQRRLNKVLEAERGDSESR
ncbi:MAG: ribose 5-phosphate isomerase B [Acidobacteria bacterium]|nr:ribose 5-phosphate isomerase B [Acidobacteriota bacterium]